MEHADIEHMAQGFPPSNIGKDHEEVVIWLATELLNVQQKLDAVLAKGMELAQEAAHVYPEYNKEMAPDVACDAQTIQEFHDLDNGRSSVEAYLNSVRAEGAGLVGQALAKIPMREMPISGQRHHYIQRSEALLTADGIAAQLRAGKDGE